MATLATAPATEHRSAPCPNLQPLHAHLPTLRQLLLIAITAVVLRLITFLCVTHFGQLTTTQFAHLYDGESYLISAEAMLGEWSRFNDYHGRVFPGVPALLAILHQFGLPLPVAGLALNWSAAAVAAVLAALLFRDIRIGWAMMMLIPHYLMNSTMTMTEAPLLAVSLAGMLLVRPFRQAHDESGETPSLPLLITAAVFLGYAGLVRPMACFGVLGLLALLAMQRRYRDALLIAAISGAVTVGGFYLVHLWRGDALAGARYYATSDNAYGGELLTWPFKSLILTPFQQDIAVGRVVMMWLHAVVALTACVLVVRQLHARRDQRDVLSAPWLLGNTAFALCIGSVWGFQCFHRFTIPAMPAMFHALRRWLPQRLWLWALVAVASTAFSILAMLRDLADG